MKFTHVISSVGYQGTTDMSSMSYLSEDSIRGLQHCVSAVLSMSKPTDPPEVLKAVQHAYDALKLLQLRAPIKNGMLV